jgi:CRP/FNR family cyclic AMP-dependent transcriptional regulator
MGLYRGATRETVQKSTLRPRSQNVWEIVLSARRKEAVVAILGSGDFFGEGSLAGQPLRMATATAITECSVLRVQKETMIRMIHDEPALAEIFIACLLFGWVTRKVRVS